MDDWLPKYKELYYCVDKEWLMTTRNLKDSIMYVMWLGIPDDEKNKTEGNIFFDFDSALAAAKRLLLLHDTQMAVAN